MKSVSLKPSRMQISTAKTERNTGSDPAHSGVPPQVWPDNMLGTIDRLMSHVSPEPNSGCWPWARNITRLGYGEAGGRLKPAHRAVYEELRGNIPEGT
jgi:hypothetical protein